MLMCSWHNNAKWPVNADAESVDKRQWAEKTLTTSRQVRNVRRPSTILVSHRLQQLLYPKHTHICTHNWPWVDHTPTCQSNKPAHAISITDMLTQCSAEQETVSSVEPNTQAFLLLISSRWRSRWIMLLNKAVFCLEVLIYKRLQMWHHNDIITAMNI